MVHLLLLQVLMDRRLFLVGHTALRCWTCFSCQGFSFFQKPAHNCGLAETIERIKAATTKAMARPEVKARVLAGGRQPHSTSTKVGTGRLSGESTLA